MRAESARGNVRGNKRPDFELHPPVAIYLILVGAIGGGREPAAWPMARPAIGVDSWRARAIRARDHRAFPEESIS
jgi:hypothetical protein